MIQEDTKVDQKEEETIKRPEKSMVMAKKIVLPVKKGNLTHAKRKMAHEKEMKQKIKLTNICRSQINLYLMKKIST